jgi:hypothetical protein
MAGEGSLSSKRSLIEGMGRSDLKLDYGIHTNAAASDTVATDLRVVVMALAVPKDDLAATASVASCSCDVGDQAGSPAAGSFLLKSWEADGTAATSFGEDINWIAIGY